MSRWVRAYHGTTLSNALTVVQHQAPFDHSDNGGDWLGKGVYFFEDNLIRAIDWAKGRVSQLALTGKVEDPAVIAAELDLSQCLDICSSDWDDALREVANRLELAGELRHQHGPLLFTALRTPVVIADHAMHISTACENTADAHVIDTLIEDLTGAGEVITAIRGAFPSGIQLYRNSYFFDQTHIQIAVLDPVAVISNPFIIHPL